jgi:F-type H+-transporting ATPase subunit b
MFNWLAIESKGIGFEFDLFESNLINLTITIGVLIYFVGGLLTKVLAQRKQAIATEIQEAEQRQRDAAQKLAVEQQNLTQAQAEAQRIMTAAQESAQNAKAQIIAQAQVEIQRIRDSASQDQSTSQERAIAEIRQRVSAMALQRVESQLQAQLSNNAEAQRQLVDRSIALLGGN